MEVTLKQLSQTPNQTKWHATVKDGVSVWDYRVTSYPDSSLIYIESFTTRRHIPNNIATKISPAISKAIANHQKLDGII